MLVRNSPRHYLQKQHNINLQIRGQSEQCISLNFGICIWNMVFCNWSHLVTCWCDVKLLNCWENKSIVARKSFQMVVRPDFAFAVGGNLWIIYFMHHCKATCDSLLWKMRPWLKWWVHLSGDAFSPQVPPHEHQLWFKKKPHLYLFSRDMMVDKLSLNSLTYTL